MKVRQSVPVSLSMLAVRIAGVIAAVAFAIFASALIALQQQRESALASATADSLRTAQGIARTEQRFIGDALQVVDFFARSPALRNGGCGDLADDLVRENPGYANAGAAWTNGEVFCSADPSLIGADLSGMEFFDRAAADGTAAVSFPRLARISPQAAAAIAVPFKDADGAVRGVVFIAQRFDWIGSALSSTYLPQGSAIGLLDRDGNGFVRATANTLRVTRVLTRVIDGKSILARGEGIAEFPIEGAADRFLAFRAVSDGRGRIIGYAYVDIPVAALGKLSDHRAALDIFFFSIAAVIAFFGGLTLAWVFIGGRLRKLSDAAARRAAGDESAALPTANGEFGRLAGAFSTLAGRASATHAELARNIIARESEVNAMLEQAAARNRDLEDARSAAINLMEDLDADRQTISREKTRAEALLAGIGDGILAMDGEARIVFANVYAERMLGFVSGWLVGKPYFDTVQMTDDRGSRVPLQQRPIMRAINTGERIEFPPWRNANFIRADGSLLPIAAVAMPLIENGTVVGSLMIFRDVSREREIDRAKSEFVSIASHQLRTPPTAIRWYSEMLLEGDEGRLTPGQKRTIVQIHDSSVRMIELISTLLNVSRMELGMYAVRPRPVRPGDIVRDVLKAESWDIRQKHLTVETSAAKGVSIAIADPDILRIVLENLVSNAVKYSNRGGRIIIAMRMEGRNFRIEVVDEGIGIPKEQQPMVFTKFFRASNISLVQGTGLGLYIVKSMCRYAGCELRFVSEPGRGSTFSLLIPELGMHAKEGEHPIFDLMGGLPNMGAVQKQKEKVKKS